MPNISIKKKLLQHFNNSLMVPFYVCGDAASLTALFKHIGSVDEPTTDEVIREKVLSFIRDKVRRSTDRPHITKVYVLWLGACKK